MDDLTSENSRSFRIHFHEGLEVIFRVHPPSRRLQLKLLGFAFLHHSMVVWRDNQFVWRKLIGSVEAQSPMHSSVVEYKRVQIRKFRNYFFGYGPETNRYFTEKRCECMLNCIIRIEFNLMIYCTSCVWFCSRSRTFLHPTCFRLWSGYCLYLLVTL